MLFFLICSNFADASVAVNRLIAVVLPHFYSTWTNPRILTCNILFCWVFAFSLAILPIFKISGTYHMLPFGACGYLTSGYAYWVVFVFGIYVPLGLTGISYYSLIFKISCPNIFHLLRNRRNIVVADHKEIPGTSQRNEKSTANKEKEKSAERKVSLIRSLYFSYVTFMVCYIPAPMANNFAQTWYFHPLNFLWLRTLTTLGSALTPVSIFPRVSTIRPRSKISVV